MVEKEALSELKEIIKRGKKQHMRKRERKAFTHVKERRSFRLNGMGRMKTRIRRRKSMRDKMRKREKSAFTHVK